MKLDLIYDLVPLPSLGLGTGIIIPLGSVLRKLLPILLPQFIDIPPRNQLEYSHIPSCLLQNGVYTSYKAIVLVFNPVQKVPRNIIPFIPSRTPSAFPMGWCKARSQSNKVRDSLNQPPRRRPKSYASAPNKHQPYNSHTEGGIEPLFCHT